MTETKQTYRDRLRVDGAVVVVTGASTRPGIGHSLACLLAAHGAQHIAVIDINQSGGQGTCDDIRAAGSESSLLVADVTNYVEIAEAVNTVTQQLQGIDILANCAGNQTASEFLALGSDELQSSLTSHLVGTMTCCEAVLPGMTDRRRGRIVNVASIAGKRGGGWIGKAAYSTAKAGVQGLTKALAKQALQYGVHVNAVNPGLTDTGRVTDLKADEDLWQRVSTSLPIRRAAHPDEIAAAMLYLASDAASYLVGETVNVDGGFMLE